MYSPDFINRKEKPASKGREDIPVEVANKIQIELILKMTPESIKNLINSGHSELIYVIESTFAEKYLDKTNALDAFCADETNDPDVIQRLQSGEYTEEDLNLIVEHISKTNGGQTLFKDEAEVQEFIKQNLH